MKNVMHIEQQRAGIPCPYHTGWGIVTWGIRCFHQTLPLKYIISNVYVRSSNKYTHTGMFLYVCIHVTKYTEDVCIGGAAESYSCRPIFVLSPTLPEYCTGILRLLGNSTSKKLPILPEVHRKFAPQFYMHVWTLIYLIITDQLLDLRHKRYLPCNFNVCILYLTDVKKKADWNTSSVELVIIYWITQTDYC